MIKTPKNYLLHFLRCQEATEITNKQLIIMSNEKFAFCNIKWLTNEKQSPIEVKKIKKELTKFSFEVIDCGFIKLFILITTRK